MYKYSPSILQYQKLVKFPWNLIFLKSRFCNFSTYYAKRSCAWKNSMERQSVGGVQQYKSY